MKVNCVIKLLSSSILDVGNKSLVNNFVKKKMRREIIAAKKKGGVSHRTATPLESLLATSVQMRSCIDPL